MTRLPMRRADAYPTDSSTLFPCSFSHNTITLPENRFLVVTTSVSKCEDGRISENPSRRTSENFSSKLSEKPHEGASLPTIRRLIAT